MNNNEAEIARLTYKYRRLILEGKTSLSPREAAKLVGPDCAYHLYNAVNGRRPGRGPRKK
ncbi:MAG: hypothetical protein KA369_17765 [Spirochaetes bacterium]|nr:hypothetical protein [Spirochaetota bacterium]